MFIQTMGCWQNITKRHHPHHLTATWSVEGWLCLGVKGLVHESFKAPQGDHFLLKPWEAWPITATFRKTVHPTVAENCIS